MAEDKRLSTALSALDHRGNNGNSRNIAMMFEAVPNTSYILWHDWQNRAVFSTPQRMLTAIRSTMEEANGGTPMLQVHKTFTPSIAAVMDRFATTSALRLGLCCSCLEVAKCCAVTT